MLATKDQAFLYGLATEGFVPVVAGAGALLHPDVVEPFRDLTANALREGIALQIASGFRSFERQLLIWNRKSSGELAVLDGRGQPVDINQLSEQEKVFAILRWSALPGASRHHWGTDLDVFDAHVLPQDYSLQLTIDESRTLFGKLHGWLDQQINQQAAMGFFRPYQVDRGGIAPEPWHLSYAPLANKFQKAFRLDCLAEIINETDIAMKATILANLDEIYQRFIEVPYSIRTAKRV